MIFVELFIAQLLLFWLDPRIQEVATLLQHPFLRQAMNLVTQLGKEYVTYPVFLALLLGSRWKKKTKWGQAGICGFCTNIGAGLAALLVKSLLGRARPYLELGAYHFVGPIIDSNFYSFPSGTTTIAFATAVALSLHFPRGRSFFYLMAGLVGLSRIYLNVHFASDVLAGAVLSVFVSLWVYEKWFPGIYQKCRGKFPRWFG